MTPDVVVAVVAAVENCVACSLVETTAASQLPILAVTADVAVAVADAVVAEDCEECSLAATAADATWVALDGQLIAVDATPVAVADVAASFAESSAAVQPAVAIHVLTSTNPLDMNTETPACKVP